ncbi:MAG: glycoside hydrolase family 13 protein [Cellulomonadaceae bacterium]
MTERAAHTSPLRPDTDWWKRAVVYQVYPRSFADSDGDGVGDVRGIIGHLDYLAELGVDVLWLSPIYRSPQDDNGYDISDYQDIDPGFGTLADVDELIAQAHARGIRIVMDLVVNHTRDEHPWFVESGSRRETPRRDGNWWRPARAGHEPGAPGAEPTDWQSYFSGPAWQYDEATGEYYLRLFSRKQPDLNWENPEVRDAVYTMMRWWLGRGVDGFRMDVINMLSKPVSADGTLPDATVGPDVDPLLNAPWLNGPRIHEFLQEMHREVLADRNLITVGETPGATVSDAIAYSDPARHEIDMVFTFEHMTLDNQPGRIKWDLAPLHLPDLKANLSAWQYALARTGWNSLYWNNHDQPRIVSRWGDDGEHRVASAKAWGTVLHLLRGTPYVYQGEEIGMTNAHYTSVEQYQDIESRNWAAQALAQGVERDSVIESLATKSRDNARTPMQWDDGPQAGFTTGEPWLPVNPNHTAINAAAAVTDPNSVFHHYRRLIALRKADDVVVNGDFTLLAPDHEQVFAYVRTFGAARLLVIANLSGCPATLDLGDRGDLLNGEVVIDSLADEVPRGPELALAPWRSFVVRSVVSR